MAEAAGTGASATGRRSRRGFRFEIADDEEGRAASQVLTPVDVRRRTADLPAPLDRRGRAASSSREWRRQAGLSNTRSTSPRAELADVKAAIEQVLAPYVHARRAPDRPAGTRPVRLIRYVLPGRPPTTTARRPS